MAHQAQTRLRAVHQQPPVLQAPADERGEHVALRLAAEVGSSLWAGARPLLETRARLAAQGDKAERLRQRADQIKAGRALLERAWVCRLLRPLWKLERRLRRGSSSPPSDP